jgi:hypothetical protein
MRIWGYGEDALTYWALSMHMAEVIRQSPLDDDSPTDNIVLMYRPSFGRAGGRRSAQFGEFDAIVGTPRAVYLIETKWTGEPIFKGQVRLAEQQIRRHQIFHWIRDRWLQQAPANWAAFYTRNVADFTERFEGKPLAEPGRRLASNLEYVLQQLGSAGEPTKDVLLYFCLKGDAAPQGVAEGSSFSVVPFTYHPELGVRIIDMQT